MATTLQPAAGEGTKQLINYRVDGGVAVIEMNDPPANTYTYEMNRQFDEAILKARMANDVYVIVLTGAGEKFFSAGANIKMLSSVDPTFKYYFCLHANEMLLRLEHTPKLVVAAINGHCVGGGLELALACDLRIARAGDYQVGLPEVALGIMPGMGGTQRLTRLVGKSRAMELVVEGQNIAMDGAQEAGLVHKVWTTASNEDFLAQVTEYAHEFCPPTRSALAVGQIKRAIQSSSEVPLDQGLALERELQQRLFASQDAKEGFAAFVQKRDALFRGR